jgi:hypothetical protein
VGCLVNIAVLVGVNAAASAFGWSDRARVLLFLGTIVVWALVLAVRQQAREQNSAGEPTDRNNQEEGP